MPRGKAFDPAADYPIGERRPDLVVTASGRPLAEISVEAVVAGEITADEMRISPEALERQAQVAAATGRPALVANFNRAAELVRIPDQRLLEIYEALRPRRSSRAQLEAIVGELPSDFDAPLSAALVREAIDAYAARGLLPGEPG